MAHQRRHHIAWPNLILRLHAKVAFAFTGVCSRLAIRLARVIHESMSTSQEGLAGHFPYSGPSVCGWTASSATWAPPRPHQSANVRAAAEPDSHGVVFHLEPPSPPSRVAHHPLKVRALTLVMVRTPAPTEPFAAYGFVLLQLSGRVKENLLSGC